MGTAREGLSQDHGDSLWTCGPSRRRARLWMASTLSTIGNNWHASVPNDAVKITPLKASTGASTKNVRIVTRKSPSNAGLDRPVFSATGSEIRGIGCSGPMEPLVMGCWSRSRSGLHSAKTRRYRSAPRQTIMESWTRNTMEIKIYFLSNCTIFCAWSLAHGHVLRISHPGAEQGQVKRIESV